MAEDTPLVAGPIHGIRTWRIEWGRRPRLRAVNGTRWRDGGRVTEARCRRGDDEPAHPAPHGECGCGLYATHPHAARVAFGYAGFGGRGRPSVVGIVAAWGRIEVHRDGFRAQYAKPVALAAVGPPSSDLARRVKRVAASHEAEYLQVATYEELVDYCRERGLGLSPSVVDELVPADAAEDPPPPLPPGPAPWQPRSLLQELWEWIRDGGELVAMGLGLLLWIALIWGGSVGLLAGAYWALDSIFGLSDEKPEFTARNLQVSEQALVRRGNTVAYVAIVRNSSDKRTAVAAFARGEVRDRSGKVVAKLSAKSRFEVRPSLAPGEVGVAIDYMPAKRVKRIPARPRFDVRVVARRRAAPEGATPAFSVRRVHYDPRRCRLKARFHAPKPVRDPVVAIVARDRRGEISAAAPFELARLPAGHTDRVVWRSLDDCADWVHDVELYPHLLPDEAAVKTRPNRASGAPR